jgi:NhaA family Na+:H+ antiporter
MPGTSDRLQRPLDPRTDHILGTPGAPVTLVEYGSYACPYCRAAHERIVQLRDQFGDQLVHAYRHRPVPGNELARKAAELVERATDPKQFWKAHVALMTRSRSLSAEDLEAVERDLDLPPASSPQGRAAVERIDAEIASAAANDVVVTPTFFINGRRYLGPWDDVSLSEALLGSMGHRVRAAALQFANWAPSTGVLLLVATVLAVILTNSVLGPAFTAFWHTDVGLTMGGRGFTLPLLSWVNDGLLTIFFLVVGLEIKREFTLGHLASRQLAALPVAAAVGGMVAPALIYLLVVPAGPWQVGWGIPIATDTAFAVALIAMMGRRVPIELRIFLTAAAIVDDIAAILVVALFYSTKIDLVFLAGALLVTGLLYALNKGSIYRVTPYALLGVLLWYFIHEGGVHATLAGVVLALFIPTRPPPDYRALLAQLDAIFDVEASHRGEEMRHALSTPALRALDAIHDRLESPADRVLRLVEIRSSYVVLPIFALANAGVVLSSEWLVGRGELVTAIMAGLVVGKPVGLLLASFAAVKLGLAMKPADYSWAQVAGAGCLAGIGFTMSLFIAGQAFAGAEADFNAAKLAIFAASTLSALFGVALLWRAGGTTASPTQARGT